MLVTLDSLFETDRPMRNLDFFKSRCQWSQKRRASDARTTSTTIVPRYQNASVTTRQKTRSLMHLRQLLQNIIPFPAGGPLSQCYRTGFPFLLEGESPVYAGGGVFTHHARRSSPFQLKGKTRQYS